MSNKSIIGKIKTAQQLQGNMKFGNYQFDNDYNEAKNKPSIEDVELIGNKTFEELGLAEIDNIEIDKLFKQYFDI